jgi:hypothetical protein
LFKKNLQWELHFRGFGCILPAKSNPVKRRVICTIATKLVLFLFLTNTSFAQQQGRVLINEYMPWTSNSCGVKSEFVELMNFGPGPVDIGCYILTTGVYSVTIPPNTILQPGQFYVIAGQDFLPGTCANVDSGATGVTAHLNWNTCNCTNMPIPTANNSEGMMRDDGYTPLVFLDPSLKVIDAVVRGLPGAATGPVTSSSSNGCTGKTFNLGTMNINYEVLGMAPGNQNSYARSLDGDCNWLKQPKQSGSASNNRSGKGTDITYQFDMVNPTVCGEEQGSVSIYVKHNDYSSIFPMSYTIALDINKDGIFDFNDQYTTETVYEPPFIEINNLPIGRFRVTVASVKGCYLQTFSFEIFSCNPGTLPVRLAFFKNAGTRDELHHLEWLLQEVQNLQSIVVEKGTGNGRFVTEKIFSNELFRGDKLYSYAASSSPAFPLYRLKITPKNGRPFYSPVINTASGAVPPARIGPNPASDRLEVQLNSPAPQKAIYTIYNSNGAAVKGGNLPLSSGENKASIPLHSLTPGMYHLQITGLSRQEQPISFRFVKH